MKSLFLKFCPRTDKPSLGAHSTSELSTGDIWATWEGATNSLHWIKEDTILVGRSTWNLLCVVVNTDEFTWLFVVVIFAHQIPIILLGPARQTVIPCGHHQQ